jgi:NAD-dependent SIR2 family protein deacetylase
MGKTTKGLCRANVMYRNREIRFHDSLNELSRLNVKNDDELDELFDEFFLKEAKIAKEENLIPSHEEYVEWKEWWSKLDHKERMKVEKMVYLTPFCKMREVLDLESGNTKKFIDTEMIDDLEKSLGSREAALAYLNGLRHAAKAANNPKIIVEALEKFNQKPLNEERTRRSINHLLENE